MKPMAGISTIAATALVTLALSGCGGGDGATITPAPTSYDLEAGYSGLVTDGQTANVTLSGSVIVNGSSAPFTGSGTLTLAASVGGGMFNGHNTNTEAQTETISGTVSAAGQSAPYSTSVVDYYIGGASAGGSVTFLGETGNGEFDVAQTPFTYPASVMAGSSGTLGTISRYTDSSMGVALGTAQLSYQVTASGGSGNSVLVAVTDRIYDTQNALIETDVTNFTLTASNVLSFTSATVQDASSTLTVTAQ